MASAVVIGGGIIGLSSAYYLQQSGWQVTVVDKGDFTNNCSYGNAGYVCPSHFVPLASPGIISQGLRWMFNPQSPFYIQPRLNRQLIDWGFKFMRSATAQNVERNAEPLRDIALLSKQLYEEWLSLPGFDFAYLRKGLLEYFKTSEKEQHAHNTVQEAQHLGLQAKVLNAEEVQAMEPDAQLNIRGALWFGCDAHLYPGLVMQQMRQYLTTLGVIFVPNAEVNGFKKQGSQMKQVMAGLHSLPADMVVIAGGSWSRPLAKLAGANIPLVGGRGYSFTFSSKYLKLQHPAVLMEGHVALTPLNEQLTRLGGTMEITSLAAPPSMNRVLGIIKSAKAFYPNFNLPVPNLEDVWYGYRPVSPDGMPYIGRTRSYTNCIIATGHAMVGMSLGPATGKLVSQMANETATSVDVAPYAVHRFQK
jgi:D-amino-acid dehydrogenase